MERSSEDMLWDHFFGSYPPEPAAPLTIRAENPTKPDGAVTKATEAIQVDVELRPDDGQKTAA